MRDINLKNKSKRSTMLTGAKMPTPNICVALLNATAFFSVSLSSCRTGMKMIPPAIGAPDAGMAAATIARKGVYLSYELRSVASYHASPTFHSSPREEYMAKGSTIKIANRTNRA